jgi:hypothetical protein
VDDCVAKESFETGIFFTNPDVLVSNAPGVYIALLTFRAALSTLHLRFFSTRRAGVAQW